jgi:hypothetical protein
MNDVDFIDRTTEELVRLRISIYKGIKFKDSAIYRNFSPMEKDLYNLQLAAMETLEIALQVRLKFYDPKEEVFRTEENKEQKARKIVCTKNDIKDAANEEVE